METELITKLQEIGNSIPGLEGKFYHLKSKVKINPYGEFFNVSAPDNRDTETQYIENFVQVNFFHSIDKVSDLNSIAEQFKTKLKTEKFNLASFHISNKNRQFTRDVILGGIYQVIHQYRIELQRK